MNMTSLMAKFLIVACILLTYHNSLALVDLTCVYNEVENFEILGHIYRCLVTNNPNIVSKESAVINKIYGQHGRINSDQDVIGFHVRYQNIHYFPRNLEKIFSNLKLIKIYQCNLKEIHQDDLKSFPNLVYLYLSYNFIEVLEQDLFAFNPDLELIAFTANKIVHIDSKVFDNLKKLSYFWFQSVPCIDSYASDSIDGTKKLITLAKTKCVSSEFSSQEAIFRNIENEAKSLNDEDILRKLSEFEVTSKFSQFRPFSNKIKSLRDAIVSGSLSSTTQNTISSSILSESRSVPCRSDQEQKFSNISIKLNDDLMKVQTKVDDLKASQCGAKDVFTDLLSSQNFIKSSINDHEISQNELKSSISNLESKMSILMSSQSDINSTLKSSQESQKSSQTQITSAINSLQSNLNNLKDTTKNSQDDIKTSLSDMEATFSDMKIFQNEAKSSLNKLKTTQNEIKISLNEIKSTKCENVEEKSEKSDGKFCNLEAFKGEIVENIEKKLANTRHKISIDVDGKIKGIEKRLMKMFEEILEEKLGKLLEAKLGN